MKRHLILCACVGVLAFALSTCEENNQVIGLLKVPSELSALQVTAFVDDIRLPGGSAFDPNFRGAVFEYTVTVAKDTTHFWVNAELAGNGSIAVICENDQITGTDHEFIDIDSKTIILTVQREYMELAEYRLTVVREDPVPAAEDVEVRISPSVGSFFIGSGVLPKLTVTARLPTPDSELSYQWYMNLQNDNIYGSPLSGGSQATYEMRPAETAEERTRYYYVEITNTIDGRTGITKSNPRAVTFTNINNLHEKSLDVVVVEHGDAGRNGDQFGDDGWIPSRRPVQAFTTPGFEIGKYLVTWELWDLVFDYADAGGYRFANTGNQGAHKSDRDVSDQTVYNPRPIGNALNPVTCISWRDAVVWCNAYSEMKGLEPVYVDKDGKVLTDSRAPIEFRVDRSRMNGKNGYRLPFVEEFYYAARGASFSTGAPWTDRFPGTDSLGEEDLYLWGYNPASLLPDQTNITTEVGSLRPNEIGLYDMAGMVFQLVWDEPGYNGTHVWAAGGTDFTDNGPYTQYPGSRYYYMLDIPVNYTHKSENYVGLRLVRGDMPIVTFD